MAHDTLHIKFQRGEIVVELEGSAAAVHAELVALRADGYGRLPEFFASVTPAPGPLPEPEPGPSPAPESQPDAPLVPIAAPARSLRFVINGLVVPMHRTDLALDLNGDGKVDNQAGNLIGALTASNVDVQAAVDAGVAAFDAPLLLRVDTEQADLAIDQRVDVTIVSGTVLDAGQLAFQVDPSRPSATLLCRLRSGQVESQAPPVGGAVVTLPVTFDLLVDVPVTLPLRASQMSFALAGDGSTLTAGKINGAISAADVQSQFGPALAKALSAKVAADPLSSTSKQILEIFDRGGCTNPDGTKAQAKDGVIDVCEVLANPIIKNVLAPDLQLFDESGHYAPQAAGTNKDSLSVGLGFQAISATF